MAPVRGPGLPTATSPWPDVGLGALRASPLFRSAQGADPSNHESNLGDGAGDPALACHLCRVADSSRGNGAVRLHPMVLRHPCASSMGRSWGGLRPDAARRLSVEHRLVCAPALRAAGFQYLGLEHLRGHPDSFPCFHESLREESIARAAAIPRKQPDREGNLGAGMDVRRRDGGDRLPSTGCS